MEKSPNEKHRSLTETWLFRLRLIPIVCIWGIFIIVCLKYRNEISVDNIVAFTPDSPVLAALVMLCMFALKSLSIVFYNGLLYAAGGIMFHLPIAIIIGTIGTVIMFSLPYFIGKKAGTSVVEKLIRKYPKTEKIREVRGNNNLFFAFFVRFIGIGPCDAVSMYMGAVGIPYRTYLTGVY